ncbi:PepSY domain-containing protein [Cellvibrio sp. pealriver]|uniref:PepSY domain-containing protein n=1 Tax=Cellvibrio sp. pealriver TaxID=1622269 RepID=UPI00066FF190|nr:PepSY domain-containing protein [Cellvibrio sp. pealriver]
MRKLLLTSLVLLSPFAVAGPECTTVEKSQWLDQTKFQDDLKAKGYEIKVFKVTDGNCYEIYGWNKEKQKVEIYFNPVTGEIVKEEIED